MCNRQRLASLAILGLLLPAAALAQSSDQRTRRLELSYFGESAKNPGARIGYEAAFFARQAHELIGAAHIGGYYTPDQSAYSLFMYIEGGYRLKFRGGFFVEARVGLGYVNSSRSGSSQLQPDGTTTLAAEVNSNYLMPIGLGGIGWNLMPGFHIPFSLFAQAGGMGRYNQGEPLAGGLVTTLGLAYQFGTLRPRHAEPSVPSPPPAIAPPLEGYDLPPSPAALPPAGPAEQAPVTPLLPPPPSSSPPPPLPPPPQLPPPSPEPPSLPPPPTVP